jgi:hypothetical protein
MVDPHIVEAILTTVAVAADANLPEALVPMGSVLQHLPSAATIIAVLSTGAGAKALMIIGRAMPPPPIGCSYLLRWFYDAVQLAGENPDRVGDFRPPPSA